MPGGGGWRYLGKAQGLQNRIATAHRTGQRSRTFSHPLIGTAFIHTVLDDHSRLAYSGIREDETRETAVSVLRNAAAWFTARGVRIERVLSGNGSCYRSKLWAQACAELGITHKRTRPCRPQTSGKIERFHRTLAEDGPSGSSTPANQPAAPSTPPGYTNTITTGPTPRSDAQHPSPG